jgi:hypothetical protein
MISTDFFSEFSAKRLFILSRIELALLTPET